MCVYYSLVLEQELYPGKLRTQYRTKALCSQHDFLRDMEVFLGSDKASVCLFLTSQSKLSHVRHQDRGERQVLNAAPWSFVSVKEALCASVRLGQPAYQPEPLPSAMSIQEELARCSY